MQKLQGGVKRKATEDLSQRPSKIINFGIKQSPGDLDITIQDIENLRKSIYRKRRSVLPSLPRSVEDVHDALDSLEYKTNKGENFLLINNRRQNMILFSCHTNLEFLCSQKKIYVDGTFEYCAKFFTQLFTIHTIKNGHYIPLVFILLPNKQAQTYFEAFELLCDYCKNLNMDLKPTEIVCDFEKAIHVGVKKIWPNIQIIGCRFHLTQSWFRKIQSQGLVADYRNSNSEIGKWLRWTFGLMYLDPTDVENCFVEDLFAELPQSNHVVAYADYLVDNYIKEDATFPPNIWASCNSSTERTTNACESFHSNFNKNFYVSHPDIFRFIDVLKDLQISTYIKMNSTDLPATLKNVKYRKCLEYKNNLINSYKNKFISRFNFIKCISYQYVKK